MREHSYRTPATEAVHSFTIMHLKCSQVEGKTINNRGQKPGPPDTMSTGRERSGPAGGITLPVAPNNFAMAVLKTSKFDRKGIGRLDLG